MRGVYTHPSATEFQQLFSGAGNIQVYKSPQRGGSLLGLISSVFKESIPFIKNWILPEIPNLVSNVYEDVGKGENIKNSIKKQGKSSLKRVARIQ